MDGITFKHYAKPNAMTGVEGCLNEFELLVEKGYFDNKEAGRCNYSRTKIWIEQTIRTLLTAERERAAGIVEKMKSERWGEHGMDCIERRRPCGNEGKPKKNADRCTICRYDEKTIGDAASRIRKGSLPNQIKGDI